MHFHKYSDFEGDTLSKAFLNEALINTVVNATPNNYWLVDSKPVGTVNECTISRTS